MSGLTKLGHGLAKVFGIRLEYRDTDRFVKAKHASITRGESTFSAASADSYVEHEPHTLDWFREITPSGGQVLSFAKSLFPFTSWIHRYNLVWFTGDMIAGVTVGAVVVPQSLSYATLATLEPQYGLYSAFMGVFLYWFFATSKDITIGPVAVMSQLVGTAVIAVRAKLGDGPDGPEGHVIASAIAVLVGAIIFVMGFCRLGFIVEFIPLTAVASFITGAALQIGTGQFAGLLGISSTSVNTHGKTYEVIVHTLEYLKRSTPLDAAMGVSALAMLYIIRFACNMAAKYMPKYQRTFFYINTLRVVFVLCLYTMICWLVEHHINDVQDNGTIHVVGTVPRGFPHAGVPTGLRPDIINAFLPHLPAIVIVAIIEHIAIAKSFGRINNYVINPSQELLAIGVTNLLGPLVGAYTATGSFSRTAIKAKAGVRTPIAGVITAIVVLIAIYALPPLFFWIPKACLSAVIIHAVFDLFTPPNTLYQFWKVNPIEVVIFFAGLIATIFSKVENGVYVTVSVSLAVFLFRAAKAQGRFMGKVKVSSVIGDQYLEHQDEKNPQYQSVSSNDKDLSRTIFLPLDHNDGSNPNVQLSRPYPGVFIYRFSEGFNYPNAGRYLENLVNTIMSECRRTVPFKYNKPGDRPWNNPGPKKGTSEHPDMSKPTVKAVILDFSSVNNIDVTAIQYLIDIRNQLDRFAAPDPVEWHMASVNNRWTKRGLVAAGFGYPIFGEDANGEVHRWKPLFNVTEMGFGGGHITAAEDAERAENRRRHESTDIEAAPRRTESSSSDGVEKTGVTSKAFDNSGAQSVSGKVAIGGINRPFFHPDLNSALRAAIEGVEDKRRAGVLHENES